MAKQVEKAYGDALFEACKEAGNLEELHEQVKTFGRLLKENPDFYKLLTHPDIGVEDKEKVLDEVCGPWAIPQLLGTLKLMVSKDRIGAIRGLFDYIVVKYKEYKRIGVVYVTTASALSEEQKTETARRILATTQFKSLEMHYKVDGDIMGGMIIKIGDRVMDTSVKTRMNQMVRVLKTIQIK